jgi:ABC-2 type transport system ATP-binding protein
MQKVLDVRGLVKRFGDTLAVNDLHLQMEESDVVGFIGPNGAGKTTTLRILATVLQPDAGEITVSGSPIRDVRAVRPLIGYMPDFFGVYEDITVDDYLQFFARVYDIEQRQRNFAVSEALSITHMEGVTQKLVDKLSRGMKQRLGLARALLHKPKLLLLDEPASGLDPEARVEFRDIVHHLRKRGTSILISSHVLPDLADMCNKVMIISQGTVRWFGETRALLASSSEACRRVRLRVLSAGESARAILMETSKVTDLSWEGNDLVFSFAGDDTGMADVLRRLMAAEVPVVSYAVEETTLERVYLEMVQGQRR